MKPGYHTWPDNPEPHPVGDDHKEEEMEEAKKRDYKKEYKKFQSSKKMKKYRAELNKYNRQKGTYGNGDKKDASHKGGKIVGFENQSKNRGRAEKSRLKKENKIVDSIWNYIKEGDELQRWKVYIKGEKKPLILTGKDKNSVKKFAHQMIHNNNNNGSPYVIISNKNDDIIAIERLDLELSIPLNNKYPLVKALEC